MSRYNNLNEILSLIKDLPINSELIRIGFSEEKLIEIIKYLQFLSIKIRVGQNHYKSVIEEKAKLKQLGNKISYIENQLYESLKGDKYKGDLHLKLFGIIATLFEFIGKLLQDNDYLIKSGILYSISEFESNSFIIINELIVKNEELKKLIDFDYKSDNLNFLTKLDLIIILNILFFSRNFDYIESIINRNKEFLEGLDVLEVWVDFFENIINYIKNGINKNNIFILFNKIYDFRFDYGNPLLFWIINRLDFHIKSFLENNVWSIKEKLKNTPENYIKELINSKIYELWKSQRKCIDSIINFGKNHIFLMPTSSGKTLIAEIQSIYHIYNKNKKILYICPTKALVNQIYFDHRIRFSKVGINSLRITGSYESTSEIDNFLFKTSNFIIMTPEKLDMFWRNVGNDFLNQFSLVIFDEFQLIEDVNRGLKYELLISKIKSSIESDNLDITLTFLSACVPDSSISPLLKWLGSNKTIEVSVKWRPTRTIEGILFDDLYDDKIHAIVFPNLKRNIKDIFLKKKLRTFDEKILYFLKYLGAFKPIMIFYENKPGCERIIKKIYNEKEDFGLFKIEDPFVLNQLDIIESELGFESNLIKYLEYGLAFHHSGLPEEVRYLIEFLINGGYIKIFACTTTFAEGVNFPVQAIIFHTLNMYDEDRGLTDLMSHRLYENIIGRAGRALKFSEGLILIPDYKAVTFNYINSDLEPLSSRFEFLEEKLIEDDFNELLSKKDISDIQVDLLSMGDLEELNTKEYFQNTFFFNKIGEVPQGILNHIDQQKYFIKRFNYPMNSKKIFNSSGLSLLFCKNLFDFIITNEYQKKLLVYDINSFVYSEEIKDINMWIFTNHKDLMNLDSVYPKIIDIWLNREFLNYKEIYLFSGSNDKKFSKYISILNGKMRYIIPWIWSFIIKLLISVNPEYIKFKLLPDFIKFGVNSKEKLLLFLYEKNKDLALSKEKIEELIS